jgi:hypothetical protein
MTSTLDDARREQELRIQALGAALSRRDWHEAERAYGAIRDKFYAAPVPQCDAGSAKAYVDRAIASYAGDPADNQFQKGFLAALEVVRDEAFALSSADRGSQ